jgi:hypothetical protein
MMLPRRTMSGMALIGAAVLFWAAWLLMPGVGVTDAREIFGLVGSRRGAVLASVVLQLVSAVLYVPALLGLSTTRTALRRPAVKWGATLLIVGAMGSAADAMLHLLAYAMTAPEVDRAAVTPVMAFMQGPGLMLLAPLLLSFFVGGALLSFALAAEGVVSRWSPRLQMIGLAAAIAGGGLASAGWLPARFVGLATLAAFSAAQALVAQACLAASVEVGHAVEMKPI